MDASVHFTAIPCLQMFVDIAHNHVCRERRNDGFRNQEHRKYSPVTVMNEGIGRHKKQAQDYYECDHPNKTFDYFLQCREHTKNVGSVIIATYTRAGEVRTGSFALEIPTKAELARRRRLSEGK